MIDCKQFLSGMAELDRPDLDLVSVLSQYKERALTVLMDGIIDDQLSKSPPKIYDGRGGDLDTQMDFYDRTMERISVEPDANDHAGRQVQKESTAEA